MPVISEASSVDPVARRGREALAVHVVVEVAQVLAQVVDRDARSRPSPALGERRAGRSPAWRRLEVGDALAQDRDEVAHHVHDRALHAEQVGVQVLLGDAVADLAR